MYNYLGFVHWERWWCPTERNTRFWKDTVNGFVCDHRIKSAIPVSICAPTSLQYVRPY